MITNLQLYLAIGAPTIAVLASMIVSLVGISGVRDSIRDLRESVHNSREHFDARIDDLKSLIDARFDTAHSELIRVEQVMDARLKHLEN